MPVPSPAAQAAAIAEYLKAVEKAHARGDATKPTYRPFDWREIYYDPRLISRPADKVMSHMLAGPNLALCGLRQSRRGESGAFFVADEFLVEESAGPRANLAPRFIEEFAAKLELKFVPFGAGDGRKTFGPEDVLHDAYAIFHAPGYRARYAEFLRIDFPRLPLTSNPKFFRDLCRAGKNLVDLHLLRVTGSLQVNFPAKGTNEIAELDAAIATAGGWPLP